MIGGLFLLGELLLLLVLLAGAARAGRTGATEDLGLFACREWRRPRPAGAPGGRNPPAGAESHGA